jgi:uncharacterized hydrophobic protein (TIGR00271 family)
MSTTPSILPTVRFGFDPGYLPAFEDKLFIEGPQAPRKLLNFFALLTFATVIATYGVLSGSTATVIGAMIVAPLMGPIMATTAGVVMGSATRVVRATILVIAGVALVITLSFFLAMLVPDVTISFTSNGEITSRINPGLYALVTALGAGAAGAYIISRAEIADSMGGVAIAISLVPPLCVVGISLQQGRWEAAGGAMLLFMTNLFAILLAGGITLLASGLGKLAATQEQTSLRKKGLVVFVVGILLITIPLAATTYQAITHTMETGRATAEVEGWLEGSLYRVATVEVNDRIVTTTIEGSGELSTVQELAGRLARAFGHPVLVNVRVISAQTSTSDTP